MSFNKYKNIAHVLQDFPLTYQEENFIKRKVLLRSTHIKAIETKLDD